MKKVIDYNYSTLKVLCLALLLSVTMGAAAQSNNIVSGTVTDSMGEPLIGVSVSEQGSKQGVITALDGRYTIKIDPEGTLVFSYVGYKPQEIPVKGQQTINITLLEDSEQLDAVVVIGYGTQKKKDLTGSIGTVNQSKMSNNASVGIGQNLQGKLAGVQVVQGNGTPYSGTTIRVRGVGSFGASSAPLIVVDGMITNDGLNNLNPDDIEDISVLKDAASASIYGSRGANGVVIVTTKKGNFETPVKVEFSAYVAADQIRHKIKQMDALQYATVVNEYYANAGMNKPYTDEELNSFGKGTNWLDEITHNGMKQNYSLNITGGSKNNSYAATMNFFVGDGLIKNTDFRRGNIKLSDVIKVLPSLKIGINMNVNYGVSKNTDWGQAIDRALIYPSTVPVYDADGNFAVCTHHGEPTTMLQPMIPVELWTFNQVWKKFLGNTFLEWEIIKGLTFKTTFYAEYTNWGQDQFIPSYTYGPKGMISDHPIAQLNVSNNQAINYEWDNIAQYTRTFNQDHNLTVMGGVTFQKAEYQNLYGSRTNFLSNDPHMQVLSAGSSNITNSGGKSMWSILSYLGRAQYDYQGKYLLSASIRVDKTSRIAKENRMGVFPGVSGGWVLSKESFLRNNTWLSFLKLRASWGVLGNQEIGTYPYQTTLNSSELYYPFGSGNEGTTYLGVGPTSIGNSEIMWEKTYSWGVGVESNFFNDRLRFIADFYKRYTNDILVRVPLLSTSGVDVYPYQNAGKCKNTGVELTLSYGNILENSDFLYDVSVNWTYNRNEVTYVPNPIVAAAYRTVEGHPINEWYGYIQEGIFQNEADIAAHAKQPNAAPGDIKYKDLNGDGEITSEDQDFIGHMVAPHIFGANISLGYKNFDLIAAFSGQLGGKNTIDAPGFSFLRGGEQTSSWMYDQRWTGEGSSNYVPRVVAGDPNDNNRRSSFWLRSTDYLRLQNIQLGYNFGPMLQKTHANFIKKLRVYIAAQNLFCINSYPGFDPENAINGYPIPRSYYAGVNVTF